MVEGPGATRNSRKVQPAIGYTVESVEQRNLQENYETVIDYSINMSVDGFDPSAVMGAIVEKPDEMISDAILEDDRFPGDGNIIKIEGLHRSQVHPKRIVSTLTRDELEAVVSS